MFQSGMAADIGCVYLTQPADLRAIQKVYVKCSFDLTDADLTMICSLCYTHTGHWYENVTFTRQEDALWQLAF